MKPITLGQLFELKYGKSLRKDTRRKGEVPVYGSNGPIDFHDESLVKHPTIIVGRKGSIGEVHLVKKPSWPIDTTYYVQSRGDYDFDIEWLYRILQTLRLKDLNRSAAIPGLNREDVYRIAIDLPPLDNQKRIAHLLSKVEGLIGRRKQHLQQLDDLLKSVFMEMFGDPVKMKDLPHFQLGEFIEFLTSGSRGWAKYYSESGSLFIRINNVKNARINLEDTVYVTAPDSAEANRTRVQAGDLLLSITADLGRTAVVPKELEGAYINQHLALVRIHSDAELNPLFLAWYFSLPYGNSFVQKKNRVGVKSGLNFDDIRGLQIVKPSFSIQNQFVGIVKKVEVIKSRYHQSLTDLETLYGALSQIAFKGDLDLTRIIIPTEMKPQIEDSTQFDLPEIPSGSRQEVIAQAFQQLLDAATPGATISLASLWQDLVLPTSDDETPELPFNAEDYDQVKALVFEALQSGELKQTREEIELDNTPDFGNEVILQKAVSP